MSSTSLNLWVKRKTWLPCFPQLHPKLLILPSLLKSYPSWGLCYSIVPFLSFCDNVVTVSWLLPVFHWRLWHVAHHPPLYLCKQNASLDQFYICILCSYTGVAKNCWEASNSATNLWFPSGASQSCLIHLCQRWKERSLVNKAASCMDSVPLSIVSQFPIHSSNKYILCDNGWIALSISLLKWAWC